jgi:hypothetical protein
MLLYEFNPESPAGVARPETTAAIGAGGFSAEVALYGAGALAFAALAVILGAKAKRNLTTSAFALACGLTAVWMGVAATQFWQTGTLQQAAFALDMTSALGWAGFVAALLWSVPGTMVHRYRYAFVTVAAVVVAASLAAGLGYLWLPPGVADQSFMGARLLLIIGTAVLLENLVHNSVSDQW